MKQLLTADIGGTNSRFAHFRVEANRNPRMESSRWFPTSDARSFPHLLEIFNDSGFGLTTHETDWAVFAVAGPVINGNYCDPPLIPWDVDLNSVAGDFGLHRAVLVNDFIAQAYACRSPIMKEALQVVPGKADTSAPLVVIGAGTGLGQAMLIPNNNGTEGYRAVASEGGHAPFPFESGREEEYCRFLYEKEMGASPVNNVVVSGPGLSLVHEFLTGQALEPAQVSEQLTEESETLRWMARFYGRACRNYALHALALGGVYISGGVAARVPSLVTDDEFSKEFHRSETMGNLLENIPVFLNRNEESGLWGGAMAALSLFGNQI